MEPVKKTHPYTPETLTIWLQERIALETGKPATSLNPNLLFPELGIDSVSLVGLSGELEDLLGLVLNPAIALEYPTIEQLAAYLCSEEGRLGYQIDV